MESKERAPAILVMVIGDCITTWDEVLLGIEGRYSLSHSTHSVR